LVGHGARLLCPFGVGRSLWNGYAMHGFGGVPLPLHFEEEYKEFRGRGCWELYQIRSTKQFTTSSLDKIFNITQFDRITSRTPPVPPPQRLQSSSSYSFIFEYRQHSSSSSSTPLKLLPIALEPPPRTSSSNILYPLQLLPKQPPPSAPAPPKPPPSLSISHPTYPLST
jgi:hypothetical protein